MVQQNAVLPHFCNDRIGKIMGGNQEEVMRTRVMRGFGTAGNYWRLSSIARSRRALVWRKRSDSMVTIFTRIFEPRPG